MILLESWKQMRVISQRAIAVSYLHEIIAIRNNFCLFVGFAPARLEYLIVIMVPSVLPDENFENPHIFKKKKIRTPPICVSNAKYFQAERQNEVYFHHWRFFISFLPIKQS